MSYSKARKGFIFDLLFSFPKKQIYKENVFLQRRYSAVLLKKRGRKEREKE